MLKLILVMTIALELATCARTLAGNREMTALRTGLAKKPPAATISANARRKAQVINNPDPRQVINISDKTFFAAINPAYPSMKPIIRLAQAGRYDAAWAVLDAFMRSNLKPAGAVHQVADYQQQYAKGRKGGTDTRADQICNHVIRVWHQQVVNFGKDMDWTNVKGRSSLYGFHYWGWASPLWRAYVRTGNERYAAGFDDLFSSWYAQRDKVSQARSRPDAIWYELGCGARVMQFAQNYYAMLGSKSLQPETRKLILKTLLGHANQLQAQQACGYTNGNFQLTASKSLYQLGLLFPMFRDAATWRDTATARLLEHAYWDFDTDGGHNERCVGYGHISMHAVRQLLAFAKDDPAPSPLIAELRSKVLEMQLWFLKYVAPTGVFIGVNDCSMRRNESLLIGLATFADDGRFLWPIRGSRRLPNSPKPKKPEFTSVHMTEGGWTFMRDGWEPDSFYLLVNWGRYGGGHTHPALLDINTFAYGSPMTIETSRFDSYDNPLEPYFRSPEAHNMVTITGAKFDRRNHQGEEVEWRTSRRADYFEGVHRAYEESGARIKRQILFIKGEYWLVIDTVTGAARKDRKAVLNWHAPHRWKQTGNSLIAGPAEGPGVQLVVLPESTFQIKAGYQNAKLEMYRSRYRAYTSQPAVNGAWFITLIVPYKDRPEPCKLEPIAAKPMCAAVRVVRGQTSDLVVFATGPTQSLSAGKLVTDARLAWLRERSRRCVMVDGSRVTFKGRTVLKYRAKQPIATQGSSPSPAGGFPGDSGKGSAGPEARTAGSRAASVPKPRRPERKKADDETVARYDAELIKRVIEEVEADREPKFFLRMARGPVKTVSSGEHGKLKVEVLRTGMELEVDWRRLTIRDRRSLALAVLREGNPSDHCLAAFYMIAAGDELEAKEHLDKGGGAATVRSAFSE